MSVRRKLLGLVACAALVVGLPATSSAAAAQQYVGQTAVFGSVIDPTPPDAVMPAKPLVQKMFFSERDAREGGIFVPNGFAGALDENGIVGLGHDAIDINLPLAPDYGHGKPVYAGVDGRAYWSYQRIPFEWVDPKTKVVHNLSVGGLVVEVRYQHTEDGGKTWKVKVNQIFHFARVNPDLKYLAPTYVGPGEWFPAQLIQPDSVMWELGTPVKANTVIGWMGDSGLNKDCVEGFDVATGVVTRCASWDKPHIHVQLYDGRGEGLAAACTTCEYSKAATLQEKVNILALSKRNIVDPAGWWAQVSGEWLPAKPLLLQPQPYFNAYTPLPGMLRYGPQAAFMTDKLGRPVYATP